MITESQDLRDERYLGVSLTTEQLLYLTYRRVFRDEDSKSNVTIELKKDHKILRLFGALEL